MTIKKWLIILAIMAILTPLGLLATGEAWGEWGHETIKEIAGYVPEGLKRVRTLWITFMPDYTVHGLEGNMLKESIGTIISAFAGAGIVASIAFLIARISTNQRSNS